MGYYPNLCLYRLLRCDLPLIARRTLTAPCPKTENINSCSLTELLMAKQLNVILNDNNHDALVKAKGHRSWREFIMTLLQKSRTERDCVGKQKQRLTCIAPVRGLTGVIGG
jgi:hypothetical protein